MAVSPTGADSDMRVASITTPTAYGIVVFASPQGSLPASGILNPHVRIEVRSGASCPN